MGTANSEELSAIRNLARRFSVNELEAAALENDRYPFVDFNRDAADKADSIGLMDLTLPESRGGSGLGMGALAAALEIMAVTDASMAFVVFSQCLARDLIARLEEEGNSEKCEGEAKGRPRLLALPLYSDPDDLRGRVRAIDVHGGYALSGKLQYMACLPVAEAAIVPADGDGQRLFFLVDTACRGVAVGRPVIGLGLRGCPVADLALDGAVIPSATGMGADAMQVYAREVDRYRGPLAAIALGILRGAYGAARDFAAARYQARKQVIEHDMVRRMLADMAAWMDLGAAGVRGVCEAADARDGPEGTQAMSLQELLTRAVTRAVTDGVQILGGYGYMKEYGQEKRMRDAKQLQAVFGGSRARTMRIADRVLGI